jgi:hypothetical protein
VLFEHILHRELQTLIMLILSSKFAFSWIAYDELRARVSDTP